MKGTEKNLQGWSFALLSALIILFSFSCKYELVKEPTHNFNEKKNVADYQDYILPPQEITASQGERKSVLLTWTPVENAVQYQIYSAESPYDTFAKISETKGAENQIIIDEESGITKYYCVCAVNYFGTVSSKSILAKGSTLAVPVITSIEASEEGNSVEVNWWMDNCSSETYADLVLFNIYVYSFSSPNIRARTLTAPGDSRKITVDKLLSNSEYYFEVEVENIASAVKENSGKTTAQTAHRVVPDAPLDFSVDQGNSVDSISLSWKLPPMVWYRENSGVSGFVLHKLDFKIYRKLAGQDDSEYAQPLATYSLGDDEEYIAGTEVSWTDDTAERGKKYTYYVQSITAQTPAGKIITADSSKSPEKEGWLISNLVFSIDSEYIKNQDDNSKFETINFNYNLSFETFGKAYTYFVEWQRKKIDNTVPQDNKSNIKKFNSLNELNAAGDHFEEPQTYEGYLNYTLYLCANDSSDNSAPLAIIPASGKYLVTENAKAVPVVEEFELKDGYKDKFVLSWKYNKNYVYIIHWKNADSDIENTFEIPSNHNCFNNIGDGATVTFEHEAESGDRRLYMLEASTGLSDLFRPNGDTADIYYETLGTASPQISSYEYDKICVEWPPVQKADENSYSVSAIYEDDNQQLVSSQNITITNPTGEDGKYMCVIDKPNGYDNAAISGKIIKLTVTSKCSATNDTSISSPLDVSTLGPALTDTSVADLKYSDCIEVIWKPVKGADAYLIKRIIYKTADKRLENTYYYDGSSLTADGDSVDPERAQVIVIPSSGKFKLIDKYKEADNELSPYENNQSLLSWGTACGYIVLPVKAGTKDKIEFGENTVKITGYVDQLSNISEKKGSTFGYGLDLHAGKSESAETQEIEWLLPYQPASNPSVYYREAGSSNNQWKKLSFVTLGPVQDGKQTASFKPQGKTEAYEYLVAYNKSASILSDNVPPSLLKDIETGLSQIDGNYDFGTRNPEKANKGYLLAVNYTAQTGSGFSELVSWDEWNYSERSIGPDSAAVRIRNYNISGGWHEVALLDQNLHFTSSQNPTNTSVSQYTDAVSMQIEPVHSLMCDGSMAHPVTEGPLMVLRDAKHYYSLEFKRGDKSVALGDDNSVYAYRNVNDCEFAKMVMAVMSNAMINIDILDFENKSDGNASFTHDAFLQLGYNYNFRFNNYTSNLLMPGGNYVGSLSISCSGTVTRNLPGSGGYPKNTTGEVTITVNKTGDLPDSYCKSIKFNLKKHNEAYITVGSTSIEMKNDDLRRIYVPFKLHDDENNYYQTQKYGWWVE